MFELHAEKAGLTVLGEEKEVVTSGSVNAHQVRFSFSADWEGLSKTAVFMAGSKEVPVLLDAGGECTIPWEVLTEPGRCLMAGVCGKRGDQLVLPTVWTDLGIIREGVQPGGVTVPPTSELWEQALSQKGDGLSYDGLNLSLMSGDKPLSSVPIEVRPVYQFGHGLRVSGETVSVDTANDFTGDNTLPITAAAVQGSIGNIEALLGTI